MTLSPTNAADSAGLSTNYTNGHEFGGMHAKYPPGCPERLLGLVPAAAPGTPEPQLGSVPASPPGAPEPQLGRVSKTSPAAAGRTVPSWCFCLRRDFGRQAGLPGDTTPHAVAANSAKQSAARRRNLGGLGYD